jgi:HPt (histidine-containing phosphotransfer) domain-containing protein
MSAATTLLDPIIDRQALDRHTMGNTALQQELFILFFDQMPVYVDQLDEAVESGDIESWRMAAHGIKGSSRALGFVRLATLSSECEIGKPDAGTVKALREAIDATRADIESV